jgi:hypothetical protein
MTAVIRRFWRPRPLEGRAARHDRDELQRPDRGDRRLQRLLDGRAEPREGHGTGDHEGGGDEGEAGRTSGVSGAG